MNVLTLGARVIGPEPAYECAIAFLGATFSGEPRHRRRLDKVLADRGRRRLTSRNGGSRRTMDDPSCPRSLGGHDDRSHVDLRPCPGLRPRRRGRRLRGGRRAGPGRGVGDPAVRPRRDAVVGRPGGRSRRSPSASAGSMRRSSSPTTSPPSRASATAWSRRASRPRSSPGWAAAASRRTCSTARSGRGGIPGPAHPRFDRSRPPWRPSSTTSIRSRPWSSSPASPARRPSPTRSSPYFWDLAHKALDKVGHHVYETPGGLIAAITDPGKSLEAIPHHDEFREVFLNPPDIGGRYSALTYVGLVPASLIGLDLDALLASAHRDARRLPRAGRGAQSGRLARHRDGHARQGRPRQADVPRRRRDLVVRGVGRAAHRREHRQARGRDRPGRPRAARRAGRLRQ